MQAVCYLYQFQSDHWMTEPGESILYDLATTMNNANLLGNKNEEYGFLDCGTDRNYIYGHFIQQFRQELEKYDAQKKVEKRVEVNSAKYMFYIDFQRRQFLLQAHQDSNLPTKAIVLERFVDAFNRSMSEADLELEIEAFKKATVGTSRQEIVNEFYNTPGRVTKVSVEEFNNDPATAKADNLSPEMKEVGQLFTQHIDKMNFKARRTGDLRKVPPISYLLERSKRPTITIYEGESRVLVPKKDVKLRISIAEESEGFIEFIEKAERQLSNAGPFQFEELRDVDYNPQIPLFEFGDEL